MRYFIILCMLLAGCKSAEKLAAEKSAKEEIAREEQNKLLEQARKKFPCDTVTVYYIDTVERVIPGDTTYRNDTVIIRLPGKETVRTKVSTVIDRAREQELENAVKSAQYAAQLNSEAASNAEKKLSDMTFERNFFKKRANNLLWGLVGAGILILAGIILKLKRII